MRDVVHHSTKPAEGATSANGAPGTEDERILVLECRLVQLRSALDEARAEADRVRMLLAESAGREADHARRYSAIHAELAEARAEIASLHERVNRAEAMRAEFEGYLFEEGARGDAAELVRLRREVLALRQAALVNERAASRLRVRVDELLASRDALLTRIAEWQRLVWNNAPEAVDLAAFIAELRRDILQLEHRNVAGERQEAALRERLVLAGVDPDAPLDDPLSPPATPQSEPARRDSQAADAVTGAPGSRPSAEGRSRGSGESPRVDTQRARAGEGVASPAQRSGGGAHERAAGVRGASASARTEESGDAMRVGRTDYGSRFTTRWDEPGRGDSAGRGAVSDGFDSDGAVAGAIGGVELLEDEATDAGKPLADGSAAGELVTDAFDQDKAVPDALGRGGTIALRAVRDEGAEPDVLADDVTGHDAFDRELLEMADSLVSDVQSAAFDLDEAERDDFDADDTAASGAFDRAASDHAGFDLVEVAVDDVDDLERTELADAVAGAEGVADIADSSGDIAESLEYRVESFEDVAESQEHVAQSIEGVAEPLADGSGSGEAVAGVHEIAGGSPHPLDTADTLADGVDLPDSINKGNAKPHRSRSAKTTTSESAALRATESDDNGKAADERRSEPRAGSIEVVDSSSSRPNGLHEPPPIDLFDGDSSMSGPDRGQPTGGEVGEGEVERRDPWIEPEVAAAAPVIADSPKRDGDAVTANGAAPAAANAEAAPIDGLNSTDSGTRAAAYERLVHVLRAEPDRLVEYLREGLSDPHPRVRRRVVLAVGTARQLPIQSLLEPLRGDPDPQVRQIVREVLRNAPVSRPTPAASFRAHDRAGRA